MLTETKRVSITKLRPSAYFPIFGTRHSRAVRGHPRRGEKVLNTRLKNVTTAQATYIVFFFKESGFCLRQRLISLLIFFLSFTGRTKRLAETKTRSAVRNFKDPNPKKQRRRRFAKSSTAEIRHGDVYSRFGN